MTRPPDRLPQSARDRELRTAITRGDASSAPGRTGFARQAPRDPAAAVRAYAPKPDFAVDPVVIGLLAAADVSGCVAIGLEATASASDGIAIGDGASATAIAGVAVGTGATAPDTAVAIGANAGLNGMALSAIAIGVFSGAGSEDAIAIGDGAVVHAASDFGIAIGAGAHATGTDSVAVGASVTAAAANAFVLGKSTHNVSIPGHVGFHGHAPVAQSATPVTLADVIAVLQAHGLCA